MRLYLKLLLVAIMTIMSGCSSSQELSPTINDMHETMTATQRPKTVTATPAPTLIPMNQNNCLNIGKPWPSESLLDGTLILANTQDQKIYLLSSGDEKPQPLSGKDPTWDSNFRLSPDGKWLAYSVLSDDGLSFTALKVRSLNGDQSWEIPYQPEWYSERYWINNEYIEMLKSEPEKNTTNPYTGITILNPFTGNKAIDLDFDVAKMNLKIAETPHYAPTLTRMIYLRDNLIPETGDPVLESIVVAVVDSGKELWTRVSLGSDLLNASWSADGNKVAIQDALELIVVNLDKGWDKVLQRDGLKFDPSVFPEWSPDGHYIAVKTYDSLAIYDPANDAFTDYCLPDRVLGFYWSPNSQQLAIDYFLPDGSREILVINVDNNTAVSFSNANFALLGWTDAYNK